MLAVPAEQLEEEGAATEPAPVELSGAAAQDFVRGLLSVAPDATGDAAAANAGDDSSDDDEPIINRLGKSAPAPQQKEVSCS